MKHVFSIVLISFMSCNSTIVEIEDKDHSAAQDVEVSELSLMQEEYGTSRTDSLNSGLTFTGKGSYSSARSVVMSNRNTLNNDGKTDSLFEHHLLNTIIPHWYGTTWAFEGHTSTPNSGEIACGYFVSTTLQHMGLKLNRYQMAQQSALSEVRTIGGKDIQLIHPKAHEIEDLSFCAEMEDGLYIVGLSNHVGFFLWKNGNGYFIHSDYVNGKVTFENALYSAAFRSDVYCFAPISGNAELMRRWLGEKEVEVVMD